MKVNDTIPVQELCVHYSIPESFVHALHEFQIIEIISVQEVRCIRKVEIREFEKMMRLHFDLEINLQGIDAIYNLLKQVNALQEQVTHLSNKLLFYEQ